MANVAMETFEEAEAGPASPDALYQLGLMYALGRGVAQDNVTAHKWFNLAATQGDARARAERELIAAEMSRDEVVEAQKLARAWVTRVH
jgi:hypothetical protein